MTIFITRHDIRGVQGLDGISEMVVHVKKIYANIKAQAIYFIGVKVTS